MPAMFHDCQDPRHPLNGRTLSGVTEWAEVVRSATGREPFLIELEHETGSVLMVGLGDAIGAVEHMDPEGIPLLAVAPSPPVSEDDVEFLCGGTATPFHSRWILPLPLVERLVETFLSTGGRATAVEWEAI